MNARKASTATAGVLSATALVVLAIAVAAWPARTVAAPSPTVAGPHVLAGDVADVIVAIRGGGTCTGTPITGTNYVVTAAHCVLGADGAIAHRTVVRGGMEFTARSVLVDTRYAEAPSPRFDAAVLIMDRVIPGASARLVGAIPASGSVTLAGLQPVDSDGSLLRGARHGDLALPQAASGGVVQVTSVPAGCVRAIGDLEVTNNRVDVPCGLIRGASGGGLFVEDEGEVMLVGVISTVTTDLTRNGVVPLWAVHELLADPREYTHDVPTGPSHPATVGLSEPR